MPSCVLLLACERVNAERIDCGAPQAANLETSTRLNKSRPLDMDDYTRNNKVEPRAVVVREEVSSTLDSSIETTSPSFRDKCLRESEYAVLTSRVRVGFTACKISSSVFVQFTSHGSLGSDVYSVGLLNS